MEEYLNCAFDEQFENQSESDESDDDASCEENKKSEASG